MSGVHQHRAKLRRERKIATICGGVSGAVIGSFTGGLPCMLVGIGIGVLLGWVWITDKIWAFEEMLKIKEKKS